MAVEAAVAGGLDFTQCVWRHDGFATEDAGHADLAGAGSALLFAQAVTQLREQRVMGGEREVFDVDTVRVAFTACSAHADEVDAVAQAAMAVLARTWSQASSTAKGASSFSASKPAICGQLVASTNSSTHTNSQSGLISRMRSRMACTLDWPSVLSSA